MENILPGVIESLKTVPPCLAPDVNGQTSPKIRMFLNSLVAKLPPGESYFEVGCLLGATLISALLDHKNADAYACDNFSQFKDWDAKTLLFENIKKYESRLPAIQFFNEDCFGLPQKKPFKNPIGIFFYDGNHTAAAQEKAIVEFVPFLAKKSIFIVDDWDWDSVQKGTNAGIKKIDVQKIEKYKLPSENQDWWNGIGAFYIEGNKV